jgi:hypothetical protein
VAGRRRRRATSTISIISFFVSMFLDAAAATEAAHRDLATNRPERRMGIDIDRRRRRQRRLRSVTTGHRCHLSRFSVGLMLLLTLQFLRCWPRVRWARVGRVGLRLDAVRYRQTFVRRKHDLPNLASARLRKPRDDRNAALRLLWRSNPARPRRYWCVSRCPAQIRTPVQVHFQSSTHPPSYRFPDGLSSRTCNTLTQVKHGAVSFPRVEGEQPNLVARDPIVQRTGNIRALRAMKG